MMLDIKKLGLITGCTCMIISTAGKCWAFPVPTADIQRIGSSIQVVMQEVMQVKQEVESNLNIVKEIQNGGYAAAAGDLFAKVQNGDYDRFGNSFSNVKNATYDATHSAQKVEERKAKEKADREEKERRMLEQEAEALEKGKEEAEKAHKKANESFFKRAYNWMKNNRSATDAALDTVNAAKNKDASAIIERGAAGVGAVVGDEDGSQISALGGVVSAGVDIGKGSNSWEEAVVNTATNGKLSGNLNNLDNSSEAAEAERAAEEEAKAEAETTKK